MFFRLACELILISVGLSVSVSSVSCILICEFVKRIFILRYIAFPLIVTLSCFSISTKFGFYKGPLCWKIRLQHGSHSNFKSNLKEEWI